MTEQVRDQGESERTTDTRMSDDGSRPLNDTKQSADKSSVDSGSDQDSGSRRTGHMNSFAKKQRVSSRCFVCQNKLQLKNEHDNHDACQICEAKNGTVVPGLKGPTNVAIRSITFCGDCLESAATRKAVTESLALIEEKAPVDGKTIVKCKLEDFPRCEPNSSLKLYVCVKIGGCWNRMRRSHDLTSWRVKPQARRGKKKDSSKSQEGAAPSSEQGSPTTSPATPTKGQAPKPAEGKSESLFEKGGVYPAMGPMYGMPYSMMGPGMPMMMPGHMPFPFQGMPGGQVAGYAVSGDESSPGPMGAASPSPFLPLAYGGTQQQHNPYHLYNQRHQQMAAVSSAQNPSEVFSAVPMPNAPMPAMMYSRGGFPNMFGGGFGDVPK